MRIAAVSALAVIVFCLSGCGKKEGASGDKAKATKTQTKSGTAVQPGKVVGPGGEVVDTVEDDSGAIHKTAFGSSELPEEFPVKAPPGAMVDYSKASKTKDEARFSAVLELPADSRDATVESFKSQFDEKGLFTQVGTKTINDREITVIKGTTRTITAEVEVSVSPNQSKKGALIAQLNWVEAPDVMAKVAIKKNAQEHAPDQE